MTLQILEDYWKGFFPNNWRRIMPIVMPFYNDRSTYTFLPARANLQAELFKAVAHITPGNITRTPLGTKKTAKDKIYEFTTVVKQVRVVTGSQRLFFVRNFGTIIHNHVGSIHSDIHPQLRRAYFGTGQYQADFNLENRVRISIHNALFRLNSEYATNRTLTTILSGSMSTILFMGLHFASVGDEKRDFIPLLNFLRMGNFPLGMSARKTENDCLLLLCSD